MGSGVAGFSLAEGARIIVEELRDHELEHLSDVRFIAYGDESYETIRRTSDEVRSD